MHVLIFTVGAMFGGILGVILLSILQTIPKDDITAYNRRIGGYQPKKKMNENSIPPSTGSSSQGGSNIT